ncbi:hypothetical protein C2S51_035713 [Perilla frutescens var. frutescens]|nr:hypothetical protein C2S51_035713 [Perilla frutescens var. frutescens]
MEDIQQGVTGKLDQLAKSIAALQVQLSSSSPKKGIGDAKSIFGAPPLQQYTGEASQKKPQCTQYTHRGRVLTDSQANQVYTPLPRVDFPKFDGSNPRGWVLRCMGYFKMVPNLPDDQKVTLAAINFEGRADLWFQNFSSKYGDVSWEQFVEVVAASGDYLDYVDKFEELKECMLMCTKGTYTEAYFVASFLSGLSKELRAAVAMFNPTTLQQAIDLGRNQLITLEALTKRLKGTNRPLSNWSTPTTKPQPPQFSPQSHKDSHTAKKPIKLLTAAQMADMRALGLCYNCDEKYTQGHRCSHRIHYMIMSEKEEIAYLQPLISLGDESTPEAPIEETQMSLHTLKGEDTITTLKFTGVCNGQKLQILIDTGSTLSFIKDSTAQVLGCQVEAATPLLIKIANGQRLVSSSQAGNFGWQMQGVKLQHSLKLLQHEGCDVILGGDWLKACSPIELDYELMAVTIRWMRKKLKLFANKTHSECQFMSHHFLFKLLHTTLKSEVEEVFVVTVQADNPTKNQQLEGLITEFEDIFQEPEGLPPARELKENLRVAQERMRVNANKSREEKQYQVGDQVYLKLQPYRQSSVQLRKNLKLSSKFFGPYTILERIDPVVYKLELPEGSRVHVVFHVFLLKKKLGENTVTLPTLPEATEDELFHLYPGTMLGSRVLQQRGEVVNQIPLPTLPEATEDELFHLYPGTMLGSRVLQQRGGVVDQILEDTKFIRRRFSGFDPCGQGSKLGGSDVVALTLLESVGELIGGGINRVGHGGFLKTQTLGFCEEEYELGTKSRLQTNFVKADTGRVEDTKQGETLGMAVPNSAYDAWRIQDQRLLSLLLSSLTEESMAKVIRCSTSHAVWLALKATFSHSSKSCELRLKDELQFMKKEYRTVSEYGRQFKSLCDQLAAIGHPVDDTDKTHWFFRGLGSSFSSFSAAQMALALLPSFCDLLSKPNRDKGHSGPRHQPHYQICHNEGHYADACKERYVRRSSDTSANLAETFAAGCTLSPADISD